MLLESASLNGNLALSDGPATLLPTASSKTWSSSDVATQRIAVIELPGNLHNVSGCSTSKNPDTEMTYARMIPRSQLIFCSRLSCERSQALSKIPDHDSLDPWSQIRFSIEIVQKDSKSFQIEKESRRGAHFPFHFHAPNPFFYPQ